MLRTRHHRASRTDALFRLRGETTNRRSTAQPPTPTHPAINCKNPSSAIEKPRLRRNKIAPHSLRAERLHTLTLASRADRNGFHFGLGFGAGLVDLSFAAHDDNLCVSRLL